MGGAAQPAPAKPILADTGACRATAIISEQLSKKAQAMPDSTGNCDFIALSNDSYRLLLDEAFGCTPALSIGRIMLELEASKRSASGSPDRA